MEIGTVVFGKYRITNSFVDDITELWEGTQLVLGNDNIQTTERVE